MAHAARQTRTIGARLPKQQRIVVSGGYDWILGAPTETVDTCEGLGVANEW